MLGTLLRKRYPFGKKVPFSDKGTLLGQRCPLGTGTLGQTQVPFRDKGTLFRNRYHFPAALFGQRYPSGTKVRVPFSHNGTLLEQRYVPFWGKSTLLGQRYSSGTKKNTLQRTTEGKKRRQKIDHHRRIGHWLGWGRKTSRTVRRGSGMILPVLVSPCCALALLIDG